MSIAEIHLFGATTTVGQALIRFCKEEVQNFDVYCYTRSKFADHSNFHYLDLDDPDSFSLAGLSCRPKVWISFAPVWKFAPFFDRVTSGFTSDLTGLCGLIACSSSSVMTKRFSYNNFDRRLAECLDSAESMLSNASDRLSLPCRILRPSLIYGQVGAYGDQNLSKLTQLMRRLPVLPLPADAGLRQPIHSTQLASVVLRFARQLIDGGWDSSLSERIALGGDNTLTYTEMIIALQQALLNDDPARRCRLLPVPNRLYFLMAAPLLFRSPKAFEAVLRISANLSGFVPAHQLLDSEPQPFPVQPLA